jgi:hypothetical protein
MLRNNPDYYNQRKTAALNPEKIGVSSKFVGIDPKTWDSGNTPTYKETGLNNVLSMRLCQIFYSVA